MKTKKKLLLIKLPAKIQNKERAIELLGGKRNIIQKNIRNENIEFKLFLKPLPLEKCISNDILLKKKTKRLKSNPEIVKTEYEVVGKISGQYDYFALHDFTYFNQELNSTSIDQIKHFLISKDEFINELEKVKKEDDSNKNEEQIYSQTQKTKAIHNIQEKKNVEYGYDRFKITDPNLYPFFQPIHIASLRNSYPKVFKELLDVYEGNEESKK